MKRYYSLVKFKIDALSVSFLFVVVVKENRAIDRRRASTAFYDVIFVGLRLNVFALSLSLSLEREPLETRGRAFKNGIINLFKAY